MLFINNEQVTTVDFIQAFGLQEVLGLEKDFNSFSIDPNRQQEFEFIDSVLQPDRLGMIGKVSAASRTIPREYRTFDDAGNTVEVRYTTMLPRPNPKTGVMEFPTERKANWRFSKFFTQGEEDLFLFMLANPECVSAKRHEREKAYYKLRNIGLEIKLSEAKENKLDEAYAYIRSLAGHALVIKALGAKINNAYYICDIQGEAALRLLLRKHATSNPFEFMELMTHESAEVVGKIKYAVEKGVITKKETGVPNLYVWVFADGTEITKVPNTQDAEIALRDALIHTQDLYMKLSKLIDKEISPEALAQLKRQTADTADKINALLEAELLTYNIATKTVHWVLKGEVVEEPILKAKKSWKQELIELFDKDKSLGDMLNENYKSAKRKQAV
jgi:hypothetical protein